MRDERSSPGPEERETPRPDAPRIYAASLSDYNAGRLHGAWIEADQEAEEIQEAITDMLAASAEPGAEEWAIHDYEGFGNLHLGEWESIEHIARIGQGITEHGPAFAAWAGLIGSTEWGEGLERFEDCYLGEWESLDAYASDLLDDLGAQATIDQLDDWLAPYVKLDVEGFARDIGTELTTADTLSGGVYVFEGW